MRVACAADPAYLPHSAAMLHSVLEQAPGAAVEFLHGPSLGARPRARLSEMVGRLGGSIRFHCVPDERIEGLPTFEQISSTMWYRIFLPELVPDAERVLYLDVDTIAVAPLAPLWEIDLGDSYLGAVTNVFPPWFSGRPEEVGVPAASYFNSGVLLMNLAAMRRDGCSRALRSFALENRDRLMWPDQDALNLVLGGRRLPLHPRWNCMNAVLEADWSVPVYGARAVEEARRDPAIRHFEGPSVNKPWHYLCERGGRELYFRHRRATPWPRCRLEGRTPRTVWRRHRLTASLPV
jgi:lipopolysaccharide biosynthesis glycosyltransferase